MPSCSAVSLTDCCTYSNGDLSDQVEYLNQSDVGRERFGSGTGSGRKFISYMGA